MVVDEPKVADGPGLGAGGAYPQHVGPHTDIDRAYGALATYVMHHAIAVDGPLREYYLTDRHDTSDESRWVTEIGWPIFDTGAAR